MRESVGDVISLFKSRIKSHRFTDETLEVLHSILASRDVPWILETRSKFRDLIRLEAVAALREVKEKPASVDEKLQMVQFFVSAFALIGDVEVSIFYDDKIELIHYSTSSTSNWKSDSKPGKLRSLQRTRDQISKYDWKYGAAEKVPAQNNTYVVDVCYFRMSCLALKYDALVLRESKSIEQRDLKVAHHEWVTFAKDSLDNGFYSIAEKGFSNALKCIASGTCINDVNDIKRLQELSSSLASSYSVQTQSSQYMKRKSARIDMKQNLQLVKPVDVGSSSFRNGIKKRHARKFLLSKSRVADTLPLPD